MGDYGQRPTNTVTKTQIFGYLCMVAKTTGQDRRNQQQTISKIIQKKAANSNNR